MDNGQQTPEFDKDIFIDSLSTVTAYITNKKGLETADKLELVHEFISQVERKITEEEHEPSKEDFADSILDILEEGSDITEKEFDDRLVAIARWLYSSIKGGKPWITWFNAIKSRIKARRAKRKERRASKKAK